MTSTGIGPPKRDTYRHGDLRRALLEAGTELARGGGPDAVVLREATRRAGVAPSAAYRHFADRRALLDAVCSAAQAALAIAMERSWTVCRTAGPRRSRPGAPAGGRAGYLRFAQAEPGLFRTAFSASDNLRSAASPSRAGEGGLTPFQLLGAALDGLVEAGVLPPERRLGAEFLAWSAVHGLAMLLIDGPLRGLDHAQTQDIGRRLIDMVERGTDPARPCPASGARCLASVPGRGRAGDRRSGASPGRVPPTRPGTRRPDAARGAGRPPRRAVEGGSPRAGRGSGRPPRPWRGSRRSAGCPTPRTPSETAPARPGRTAGSRRRPPAGAPGRRRRGPRRSVDRPTPPPSRPPARPGRPSRPRRAAHAGRRSVGTPRLAPRPPAGWPRVAPPPPARPRAPAPCPPPAARGADHRVGTWRVSAGRSPCSSSPLPVENTDYPRHPKLPIVNTVHTPYSTLVLL
jgi:AcrR family transcriptional regulator